VFSLTEIQDIAPFSLDRAEKEALYLRALSWLSQHHYDKCSGYQRILDVLNVDPAQVGTVQDVPFIPVRLFKEYDLLSVDRGAVVKTMTSSGTSGQRVSKIFLDKDSQQDRDLVYWQKTFTYAGHRCRIHAERPQYVLRPWRRHPWFFHVWPRYGVCAG
jgi:phenylacetate-coenzyme A ligase PaaK-like adenylate-forming protein